MDQYNKILENSDVKQFLRVQPTKLAQPKDIKPDLRRDSPYTKCFLTNELKQAFDQQRKTSQTRVLLKSRERLRLTSQNPMKDVTTQVVQTQAFSVTPNGQLVMLAPQQHQQMLAAQQQMMENPFQMAPNNNNQQLYQQQKAYPTSQSELGNEVISAQESAPGLLGGRKFTDRSVSRERLNNPSIKAKQSRSILPKRMTQDPAEQYSNALQNDLKAPSRDNDQPLQTQKKFSESNYRNATHFVKSEVSSLQTSHQQNILNYTMLMQDKGNSPKSHITNKQEIFSRVQPATPVIPMTPSPETPSFWRMQESLQQCIEFASDESATVTSVVKLLNQAINCVSGLNAEVVTREILRECIEHLLQVTMDQQNDLSCLPSQIISQKLLQTVRLFFELKAATNEFKPDISVFQTTDEYQRSQDAGTSPSKFTVTDIAPKDRAAINEIMVKIEMKKLNSIIANKDPLKNSLLLCDNNRTYPLCKKPAEKVTARQPQRLWQKKITRLENKDSVDDSQAFLAERKAALPYVNDVKGRNNRNVMSDQDQIQRQLRMSKLSETTENVGFHGSNTVDIESYRNKLHSGGFGGSQPNRRMCMSNITRTNQPVMPQTAATLDYSTNEYAMNIVNQGSYKSRGKRQATSQLANYTRISDQSDSKEDYIEILNNIPLDSRPKTSQNEFCFKFDNISQAQFEQKNAARTNTASLGQTQANLASKMRQYQKDMFPMENRAELMQKFDQKLISVENANKIEGQGEPQKQNESSKKQNVWFTSLPKDLSVNDGTHLIAHQDFKSMLGSIKHKMGLRQELGRILRDKKYDKVQADETELGLRHFVRKEQERLEALRPKKPKEFKSTYADLFNS